MCLIIVCKENRVPIETLQKAWVKNNDGAGVMYINKETKLAHWKKGFTTVHDVFNYTETLELPFIIHLRNASVGLGKDVLLTHPFVVSPESPLLLEGETEKLFMHNGTMYKSDWELALSAAGLDAPNEVMSDSRAIAMILSQHKNCNFLKKIKGNFIFLDGTKDEDNYYLIGDTFQERDGNYYSNMEWQYQSFNDTKSSNHNQGSTYLGRGSCDSDCDENAAWEKANEINAQKMLEEGSTIVPKESVSIPVKSEKKKMDDELDARIEQEIMRLNVADRKRYRKWLKRADKITDPARINESLKEWLDRANRLTKTPEDLTSKEVLDITGQLIVFCKECAKPLTKDRIELANKNGHFDTKTMKCLECARKTHVFYLSEEEAKKDDTKENHTITYGAAIRQLKLPSLTSMIKS